VNGALAAPPATGALRKGAALKTVQPTNYKLNLALKTPAHVSCLPLKLSKALWIFIFVYGSKFIEYCYIHF